MKIRIKNKQNIQEINQTHENLESQYLNKIKNIFNSKEYDNKKKLSALSDMLDNIYLNKDTNMMKRMIGWISQYMQRFGDEQLYDMFSEYLSYSPYVEFM